MQPKILFGSTCLDFVMCKNCIAQYTTAGRPHAIDPRNHPGAVDSRTCGQDVRRRKPGSSPAITMASESCSVAIVRRASLFVRDSGLALRKLAENSCAGTKQ